MRAILIDPTTKTVSEVDYDGDYRNISKLISAESGLFTTGLRFPGGDTLFVDDEGLLVNPNPNGYFTLQNYPGVFAGKGLVIGTNDAGEDRAAIVDVAQLREHVVFIDDPTPESIEPKITFTSW